MYVLKLLKYADATLLDFCSAYSMICLVYLSFNLNFLFINYLDIRFNYSYLCLDLSY
jgi:hypothetical protein